MDIREAIRQSNLIENITDDQEIDQSILAWEYLSVQPVLTHSVVLHTHRLITTNFPEALPGRYRNCNVMVGGRTCPHYDFVPSLMDNWLFAMENPLDCTTRAMHIKFEHIHPFLDGNGRTGRMLMWYHQKKIGIPQMIIRYKEREIYYRWFE